MKNILMTLVTTGLVLGLTTPSVTALAKTTSTPSISTTVAQDLVDQASGFSVPLGLAQAESTVKSALAAHPYINELVSSVDYSSSGSTTKVTVNWLQTKGQTATVDAQINQVLGRIVKPGMSDYDKEFVIHNWIVNHVAYDTSETKYTPYDAMVEGSAVCQGIATLAYRMLTTAGIPTYLVAGTAGGGSHLWDEVEIGGHWYQLDVTWDDPVNKQPGTVSYAYYNVTSAQLAKDHTWHTAGLPVANTNFESTIAALLKTTKDPEISQIASATGISADLTSQVVTAQTLKSVMQSDLNAHKKNFTLKFQGSMSQASGALNALSSAGLYGFSSLSYTLSASPTAGDTMIDVTAAY
ncbi:transglutaminase domain-containing protein [Alicyclobacillus fastidiosus]|uniref:Transglutaminase domain-containing protein n=1 Tax=Alicyclobacillus fastidiosus TaxID=392011 RepID=A0ABV5AEU5_9BACL|nr:transglutaminase domain-containing protein [Alicyclobacillus fastidiosus]WEH09476.1 transglutaminase domain-containing protein [Alicyclobacillus fastidiosus]